MSFIRKWINYLRLFFPYFREGYAVIKWLLPLLLATLGGLGATALLSPSGWLAATAAVLFLCLIVCCFSFTAGMAAVTRNDPSASLSKLQLDDTLNPSIRAEGLFWVELQNGDVSATPYLQMEIPNAAKPLEFTPHGHWRGKPERVLAPGEKQQFGLIGVGTTPKGNPSLFVWYIEGLDWGRYPVVTKDAPLDEQSGIDVEVRVVCKPVAQVGKDIPELVKVGILHFRIVPDPSTNIKYRIEK
jgi:hypothetical protein